MPVVVYSVIGCLKIIDSLQETLNSAIQKEEEFQSLSRTYITQFKQIDHFNRWLHSPNCEVRQELHQHRGELYDKREERQDEEYTTDHSTSLPVKPLLAPKLDNEQAMLAAMRMTEVTGNFHFAVRVIADNQQGYIPGSYWIYDASSGIKPFPFMEIVDEEQPATE